MDNIINDDRDKMLKKYKKKFLLMYIVYQTLKVFCAYSEVSLVPFIKIILVLFGVDLYVCEIVSNVISLFLFYAPIVCFFVMFKTLYNDARVVNDLLQLYEVDNFKVERKEQRIEKEREIESKKEDIKQIIDDFKCLSRKEQMDVLNRLKEKRNLGTAKNIAVSDMLQDEFEDILFPDFNEDESRGYTRKRIKK